VTQIERQGEQFHRLLQRSRRLGFHERTEFGGGFVHGIRAHAHGHALVRTQRVDGHRKRRRLAVDGGLLDEQRLAAGGRFHFAVCQLGDFEFRGDGL
jgi:hypothetical protein